MIQDVIRTLITEFPDNHGSQISKIPYFGVSPIPDTEKLAHRTAVYDKKAGETISTYEPAKYISVDSVIGRTDLKGKTWASSSNAISYINSNKALNDPRYYYRFFYPSRDTLGVSNNGEIVVVAVTPTANIRPTIQPTTPSPTGGGIVRPVGGGSGSGGMNMGGGY